MPKLLLALAALSTASAFQAPSAASAARSVSLRAESSTALVPVNDENIATSSAVTAAGAGFLIGGPVVGAVTAAAGNYASKQENEVGEVVRGVGKVSLDVFNFILKLNGKYDLTGKAGAAVTEQIEKLKAGESGESVTKLTTTVDSVTSKISELNEEYDLLDKGKQAVGFAGDLSVKAIDKGIELNKEYKITEQIKQKVTEASSKAVDAAKTA